MGCAFLLWPPSDFTKQALDATIGDSFKTESPKVETSSTREIAVKKPQQKLATTKLSSRFIILALCPVLCPVLFACKPAGTVASMESSTRTKTNSTLVKGLWLGTNFASQDTIQFVFASMQTLHMNTIYPEYTMAKEHLDDVIAAARNANIRVVLWNQTGIKYLGVPNDSERALYLPCHDADGKYYLDTTNPDARQKVVDLAREMAAVKGISGIQFDDHMGYDTRNLSCISNPEALRAGLTTLSKSIYSAIHEINSNVSVEIASNPYAYANKNFLADWKNWKVDLKSVQTYVPANFSTELSAAQSLGAHAVGLHSSNPKLASQAQIALSQGTGVIVFNWPNAEQKDALASVFKNY